MNHEMFWSVFLANCAFAAVGLALGLLWGAAKWIFQSLVRRQQREQRPPQVPFIVGVELQGDPRRVRRPGRPIVGPDQLPEHFNVICPDGEKRHEFSYARQGEAQALAEACDSGKCIVCGNDCRQLGPHVVAKCEESHHG